MVLINCQDTRIYLFLISHYKLLISFQTSRIVGTVFKGLGVVLLKLNELMQELLTETNKALSFPMEILKGGDARINLVISARTVAGSDGDDDSASLLSDTSDTSTMGATFDADDFPIGALMTIGTYSNDKEECSCMKECSYVKECSCTKERSCLIYLMTGLIKNILE